MLASQKTKITELFKNALAAVGAPENTKIVLERPKQQSHGDIACTVALQCAKAMKQPPRVIAEKLVEQLRKETADSEMFSAIEIAGPGFINLKLAPSLKQDVVREILKEGPAYGCSDAHTGESILLEYVSANPTGPLHLGHARQGALGDVLSRLLKSQGWAVTREFYYNDAATRFIIWPSVFRRDATNSRISRSNFLKTVTRALMSSTSHRIFSLRNRSILLTER